MSSIDEPDFPEVAMEAALSRGNEGDVGERWAGSAGLTSSVVSSSSSSSSEDASSTNPWRRDKPMPTSVSFPSKSSRASSKMCGEGVGSSSGGARFVMRSGVVVVSSVKTPFMGLGGNELAAGDGDMNLEGVGLLPETDSELLRFVMTARLSFA